MCFIWTWDLSSIKSECKMHQLLIKVWKSLNKGPNETKDIKVIIQAKTTAKEKRINYHMNNNNNNLFIFSDPDKRSNDGSGLHLKMEYISGTHTKWLCRCSSCSAGGWGVCRCVKMLALPALCLELTSWGVESVGVSTDPHKWNAPQGSSSRWQMCALHLRDSFFNLVPVQIKLGGIYERIQLRRIV